MTRRGRGDEERTSIEVTRFFALGLAREDASGASSQPTALTPARQMARKGERGREGFSGPYPSFLHVTRKLNKKRHIYCAAKQESQLCKHWATRAATKRRPHSVKSHKPPAADAIVTELSGGTRLSPHGCAEHCVPRRPACLPTVFRDVLRTACRGQLPADVSSTTTRAKTYRQCTRTDTQTCRERHGRPQRRCCARILLTVRCIGPTNGNHKLNHLEVRTRSARNGPYAVAAKELMGQTLSDVSAKYWEVEPSATPQGAPHNNDP